jgi:hypothetical protein
MSIVIYAIFGLFLGLLLPGFAMWLLPSLVAWLMS